MFYGNASRFKIIIEGKIEGKRKKVKPRIAFSKKIRDIKVSSYKDSMDREE